MIVQRTINAEGSWAKRGRSREQCARIVCFVRMVPPTWVVLFAVAVTAVTRQVTADIQDDPKTKTLVILVSGVRWDDILQPDDNLDGFRTMAKQGVRAKFVNPVFPSDPLPNWYSITTGLYPESNGVISEELRTDVLEPIWSAAEREGIRTNCKITVTGCPKSLTELDLRIALDAALDGIKEDNLDLVVVRYEIIRNIGRENGPKSLIRKAVLGSFDGILEQLQNNITRLGLDKLMNVVVLSDQGMTNCKQLTKVDLEPLSDLIHSQMGQGAVAFLQPFEGLVTKLSEELKDWQAGNPGVRVYRKEHIPKKMHLKKHSKLPHFLVQAKKGYYILPLRSPSNASDEEGLPAGCQGFDATEVSDMRAIFLARGPAFRRNYTSEPLSNVDHYNLFCHLLDIAPAPNNGSWERVDNMLHEDEADDEFDEDIDYEDEEEEDVGRKGNEEESEEEHDPDHVLPDDKAEKAQASRAYLCSDILVIAMVFAMVNFFCFT